MKLYDPESKRVLTEVTLFLTPEEALQLAACVQAVADDPRQHHAHVSSCDYDVEITVAVYTPETMDQFNDESQRVINAPGSKPE